MKSFVEKTLKNKKEQEEKEEKRRKSTGENEEKKRKYESDDDAFYSKTYKDFVRYQYYKPKFQNNRTLVLFFVALSTLLFLSCLFLGAMFAREHAKASAFIPATTTFASRLFVLHFPFLVVFLMMMDRVVHIWTKRQSLISNFVESIILLSFGVFCLCIFGNVIVTWFREIVEGRKNRKYYEKAQTATEQLTFLTIEKITLEGTKWLCKNETFKSGVKIALTGLGFIASLALGFQASSVAGVAAGASFVDPDTFITTTCNTAFSVFATAVNCVFLTTGKEKDVTYSEALDYSVAHIASNYVDTKLDSIPYTGGVGKCIPSVQQYLKIFSGLLPAAALYEYALDKEIVPTERKRGSYDQSDIHAVKNLLVQHGIACSSSDLNNLLAQGGNDKYQKTWINTISLLDIGERKDRKNIQKITPAALFDSYNKSVNQNPLLGKTFNEKKFTPRSSFILDKINVAQPKFGKVFAVDALGKKETVFWPTYEFIRENQDVLNKVFIGTNNVISPLRVSSSPLTKREFEIFIGKDDKINKLKKLYEENNKIDYTLRTLPACAFASFRPTLEDVKVKSNKDGEIFRDST